MHDSSPRKRAKVSTAPVMGNVAVAAAAAAMTGEPALLLNIVNFIPRPTTDENSKGTGEPTAQPTLALETIAALCRAIPGLGRLVGPTNEAFWREMVLAHFDFETSGDTFNVEDWGGDWCDDDEAADDECDDPAYALWHRHPKNGPRREWSRDHPDEDRPVEFLVEDLEFWSSLQTYFKPAAYGFLEQIQQERSLMAILWPDHEDAFSLFCDLLLLPRFQSTDVVEWETWSDGQQLVYPCLMGRFPTKIVGRGFAMLKFCDFVPYFWTGNDRPVSKRWSGFDGALPVIACKLRAKGRTETTADDEEDAYDDEDDDDADHSECEERMRQERSIFPGSEDHVAHPFLHLRRFVYETFSDWRRVHISQCEMASPEFYLGPTKRSGRWMGFVGQSDYLSYGREGDEEDY